LKNYFVYVSSLLKVFNESESGFIMELGIKGKKAIVCASSRGLGFGCAEALAQAGVNLTICARNGDQLHLAEKKLTNYGVEVISVCCDVTSETGQSTLLQACPDPDILINNAGGPPPGIWSEWDREDFISALDANMITPITLIRKVLPMMINKKWGRIVNITSQAVKAPVPALGLSNSARAGLTGYVAGTSRQVAKHGVTINNLLPGMHDTQRLVDLDSALSEEKGVSLEEARTSRMSSIPAGRYGTIHEFGNACAFICSQHAAFMVGQNILLDGGAVNSTI
jgi:3-oxoacyl-[acyl-carrier protein] reductase